MTDAGALGLRPVSEGMIPDGFVPIDRAEIVAAIEKAGYSQASVCREMVVKYRTWMNWMAAGWMPGTGYTVFAMVVGLPEPNDDVKVPRVPWVFLRRVEDVLARIEGVEERLGRLEAGRDEPQSDEA